MKNKLYKFLIITCIFVFCACSKNAFLNKDLNEMNIIELNKYNEYLLDDNQYLNNQYNSLIEASQGKNKSEIITMINYLNNEVIKSNVMITNESKEFFHSISVSSGSGTIIKEDDAYYYILTNNHVIYSLGRNSLYVYDYLNNEYSAQLLFNDANYDMAVIRVKKASYPLRVSKLANDNAEVDENIIAIGQPKEQRNAITFGEVLKYEKVNCNNCNVEESNINYDCVYYDAITTNGNSGGMVIDYDYNLVAVVTYGMTAIGGKYMYGAGSPVSKVKEFLLNNNFEVGDYNA